MNDATIITTPPTRTGSAGMTEPPLGADNYQIGGEIARGGMGSILQAEDSKLKRTVAVKIMHLDANADASARQRFLREAEVLAMLAHPNIVPIYDIVWEDGLPLFYSMKMVKGRNLQAIINDLRQEHPEALSDYTLDRLLLIFRKVCDAIAFAHNKGVLHRDLKPENVMVGEFGEVLVMDWGLAKMMRIDEVGRAVPSPLCEAHKSPDTLSHERSAGAFYNCAVGTQRPTQLSATLDGSVMGTPQYMSPEQAMGQIDELDERSDIFSLGGILYAILTLRPPVEGKTLEEVLEKVRSGSVTSPSRLRTTSNAKATQKGDVLEAKLIKPLPHTTGGRVPAALSSVVMKALRLDKSQRYQSVGELSADIEAYQGGFATSAEGVGALKQLKLLMLRHKAVTASLAAMVVLSVGFVFKVMASERSAKASEAVAVREKEATRQALAKSALALAEAAMREADGPAMQAALNDVPDDLRESTWSYLLGESDSSIARIRTSTNELEGAAADPSRPGVFAVADRNHKITLLNVQTGERLIEFAPGFAKQTSALGYRLAFTPDGQHLAIGRDGVGGIVIHRARDGGKEREWAAPKTEELEFGSETKLLQKSKQGIHLWDASTGMLMWQDEARGNVGIWGVFRPGGSEVVKYSPFKLLQLVSVTDGSLVRDLRGRKSAYSWKMLAHPDGQTLFTWNTTGVTECVSLQDGKVLFTLPQKKRRSLMGITSDGTQLVTLAPMKDGAQSIEIWNAQTGDLLRSVLGGLGEARALSVHPLSNEMLATSPKSRAWNLTGQPPGWRYPVLLNSPVTFWGSDDLVYASYGSTKQWGLLRLKPGGMEPVWLSPDARAHALVLSADKRIAALCTPGANHHISLLRNPGPMVEEFASLKAINKPKKLNLSPTGDLMAVMSEFNPSQVKVMNIASGKLAFEPELPDGIRVNDHGWLSSDRLLGLVTLRAERGNPGTEERVVLWDATSGKIVQSILHRTTMDTLALAPDGSRFAEGGADKHVRIRDAVTLAVKQEFRAHDAAITALAWHPTQPILATASADLSIRLWNLETGRRLEEFHGPLMEVTQLTFSPGGQRLGAAAAKEGFARIWEPRSLNKTPTPLPESSSPTKPATGEWKDLLATLTPARVAQSGNGWHMDNGVLFSPVTRFAVLPLPGNFSGTSYQVRVKLRQLSAQKVFRLVLPIADQTVGFEIDGWPAKGYRTGLARVNGLETLNEPGSVHGRQVLDSELHDLEVTVRLNGATATITATLDDRPIYSWTGPVTALTQSPDWKSTPGALALGTMAADWVVYEVKVKRLEK